MCVCVCVCVCVRCIVTCKCVCVCVCVCVRVCVCGGYVVDVSFPLFFHVGDLWVCICLLTAYTRIRCSALLSFREIPVPRYCSWMAI